MKQYYDIQLLTPPQEIADTMGISRKSRGIYRTYIPTKENPKLHKRKMLDAMDIYSYLTRHNITKEEIVTFVKTREATIEEIRGKIK